MGAASMPYTRTKEHCYGKESLMKKKNYPACNHEKGMNYQHQKEPMKEKKKDGNNII